MLESNVANCPSLVQLEELAAGQLDDAAVSRHVASCESCAAHLAAIRAANQLLEELKRSFDGVLPPEIDESKRGDATLATAPAIRGYEIIAELHRGGQGVVYQATQLATKRLVAIKVLLAGVFATTRQRMRFEREVDLMASLHHPNIVTVYDSGITADGRHWLAMEFVEGHTIAELLRRGSDGARSGATERRDRVALFAKICAAVHAAHQRGVIHRDLKPSNIIIEATGEPHVLDFGLARPIDPHVGPGEAAMTIDGGFVGTIAYSSPEQALGQHDRIDVRSDVYSLGVILFEMLTGGHPYDVTGPLSRVLQNIVAAPPRSLCAVERNGHRGDRVDNDLQTIVHRALAKEPERRYQSAEALARDVEHYLGGEAIDAKRDRTWYVLGKALRRHRWRAAAAVAFLLLLMSFTAAMTVLYQRAQAEGRKVAQINTFLEDTLGSVGGGRNSAVSRFGDLTIDDESRSPHLQVAESQPVTRAITVREFLDDSAHWIELALGDQPEINAAVRVIIGNGYRNLGEYEQAEHHLTEALAINHRLFGNDDLRVAKSLSSLSLLRCDQGRCEEAVELAQNALSIRQRQLGADHPDVSLSLGSLAAAHGLSGRLDEAERLLRRALEIRVRRFGGRHADVAMSRFRLAQVIEQQGRLEEASLEHAEALAVRRAVLHNDHPDLAHSLLAIGTLNVRMHAPGAAVPQLVEAVELRRRALPSGHWRIAEAQCTLGECLTALGRFEEASRLLLGSYEVLLSELGATDRRTISCVQRLVNLYEHQGDAHSAAKWRLRLDSHHP